MDLLSKFNQTQTRNNFDFRVGDTVKVYWKFKEKDKERIQIFEGIVIAKKHGKGPNATFTVRKISSGIGVERIFPLHSPQIENIEVVKRAKVRRAKLYFLREAKGKRARLTRIDFKKPSEIKEGAALKEEIDNKEKEEKEIKEKEEEKELKEELIKKEKKSDEKELEKNLSEKENIEKENKLEKNLSKQDDLNNKEEGKKSDF